MAADSLKSYTRARIFVSSATAHPAVVTVRFPLPMAAYTTEIFIQGVTPDGRTFRPSDWAERLAGVMSTFRPGGSKPGARYLGYSPWCLPTSLDGVKCVVVHPDLREHNVMAWDFVMSFARDNELLVTEACLLPDAKPGV